MMKRFVAGLAGLVMAVSIFTFGFSTVSYAAEKTEDEVLQIAVEASKYSESVVQYSKVWKDTKDGKEVYKVEFYVGKARFNYTIDIETGKVIDKTVKS